MDEYIMKMKQLSLLLFLWTQQCISKFVEPRYSWDYNYHTSIANMPTPTDHPALIIQALTPGPPEELLSITSRVNRAYAKRWGFDYLSVVVSEKSNSLGYWEACPHLLQKILDRSKNAHNTNAQGSSIMDQDLAYETVVFLEADAVVVQFDYNIIDLIEKHHLVASGAVISNNSRGPSNWSVQNIYSDVMIWNMKHPLIHTVTSAWLEHEKQVDSTMKMLDAMKATVDSKVIQEIPKGMVDGLQGTLIKQDWKTDQRIIKESDLPKIVPAVQAISDNTCYLFFPQCEIV
eukprot:14625_1